MFKSLFSKKEGVEVPVVEVPAKAVENIDPRLIVKTGKRGKTVFMKSPCVGECTSCPKQFTPNPPEDGKTFCLVYPNPATKWTGKICPFMYKPPAEKEQKINPAKASRRMVRQASPVAAITGSKETAKKKTERRDSR